MKMWAKQTGFTIVELLIVIVVIAILAAITVVSYNGIQGRATYTKINGDLVNMRKLIELYKVQNGTYPATNGSFRYQRASGDNFIPGLVPDYTNSLPSVTSTPFGASNNNDTYIYASSNDASGYVVQRLYQPTIPAGEWSNVPAAMKQTGFVDRYGYGNGYAGY